MAQSDMSFSTVAEDLAALAADYWQEQDAKQEVDQERDEYEEHAESLLRLSDSPFS